MTLTSLNEPSPRTPNHFKTGAPGGQRSEVKGEVPATPEPEDMSEVGHLAPLSHADLSQHPTPHRQGANPLPAPQIRCTPTPQTTSPQACP